MDAPMSTTSPGILSRIVARVRALLQPRPKAPRSWSMTLVAGRPNKLVINQVRHSNAGWRYLCARPTGEGYYVMEHVAAWGETREETARILREKRAQMREQVQEIRARVAQQSAH
jgi:hypothetical protein